MCYKPFNPLNLLFVYVNATMYVTAFRKLVIIVTNNINQISTQLTGRLIKCKINMRTFTINI